MSLPSSEKQKELLYNIIVYLNALTELKTTATPIDAGILSDAVKMLQRATGLSLEDRDQAEKYVLKGGKTLESLFCGSARPCTTTPEIAAEVREESSHPDQAYEEKYKLYIEVLTKRGYFSDVSVGSAEYQQRLDMARAKFAKRFPHASESAADSSSSSSDPAADSTAKKADPEANSTNDERRKKAMQLKEEGNAKLAAQAYSDAVSLYTEAIALNSEESSFYSNRAAAHYLLGRYNLAIEDSKAAIAIDPQYTKAYSRLGLAYFSIGKYKDAIEVYKKSLQLDPTNENTKNSLQAACDKLKAQESAAASPATDGPANIISSIRDLMGDSACDNPPNMNALLNDPRTIQMAQQVASNPQLVQLAQQLISNPAVMNSFANLFASGQSNSNANNSSPDSADPKQ